MTGAVRCLQLAAAALLTLALWLAPPGAGRAEALRLAVTTSFHNSGLADLLLPEIASDIGLEVQLLVVGTGQAIRLGMAGDVDAVLVHSRAAEEAFVASGHGTHRTPVMYNDFVVVGPAHDPARVRSAGSAVAAFRKVAAGNATFVSRGDDSGTHKAEMMLWRAAGIAPAEASAFDYRAAGAGMGAALNIAAALDAYILCDRASWLNFANKSGLALLFSGDPAMFNQYAFMPVNPVHHPHVKAQATARLEAWLISPAARDLINGYHLEGTQLFHHNANSTVD